MLPAYRAVAALLLAVGLSVAGNSLIGLALPLAAASGGWSQLWIGSLGSAYFAGMLLGAFYCPYLIQRVGHDRAYTAVIAMATVATLGFSVLPSPLAWIVFRGVIGFSFAVLYAVVESWLQGASDNGTRGRVLAIYSVVQNGASALGNQGVLVAAPGSSTLFEIGAIAVAASIIPMAMSSAAPPERPQRPTMPFGLLWQTAPIGLVGVFLIGFANGPFWTMTPVFANDLHLSTAAIGIFMTAVTLGGALFQMPIGALSDRSDRRLLLAVLILATMVLELALGLLGTRLPTVLIYALGLGLGGVIATQYYVLIAHVNDRTGRDNVVGIAALMLFLYCCGAMIGPLTAAKAMEMFGPGALMYHNAVVHLVFLAYVVWRIAARVAPTERTLEPVVLRSTTS